MPLHRFPDVDKGMRARILLGMKPSALRAKADWVRQETLRLHKRAPETRVASALSCVELFTALFYGGFLRYDAEKPDWRDRDRLIVSKGHGAVSLYPVLADIGFFDRLELERIGRTGGLLKAIADPSIPGFETLNGSLGHGLGVGVGCAIALRSAADTARVVVLMGDGELYEGSVWEAIMFAAAERLDNLYLLVDANGAAMLDYCRNIIDLTPIENRLSAFGWETVSVENGHDVSAISRAVSLPPTRHGPRAFVIHTVKGKGVPELETDPMSHIRTIDGERIDALIRGDA